MILTPDVCNAQGMLARLDAGISWCRMSFKPKSRSLSILDSEVAAKTFSVAGQARPSPTVMDEPVKRLGRLYDVSTKDENATQHIRDMTENGLVTINKTGQQVSSKCVRAVMPIARILWPLLINLCQQHTNHGSHRDKD